MVWLGGLAGGLEGCCGGAGVRDRAVGRSEGRAGVGSVSWVVASQTKSWVRLVFSRNRTRAEAAAGW